MNTLVDSIVPRHDATHTAAHRSKALPRLARHFLTVIFALLTVTVACARPILIHERERLTSPDPSYEYFGFDLAVDGDWAIVISVAATPGSGLGYDEVALLYRRLQGHWKFQRVLVTDPRRSDEETFTSRITMGNGFAVLSLAPMYIFQLNGSTWTPITHPFTAPPGSINSPDVGLLAWNGSTLAAGVGGCLTAQSFDWGALVATRRSDGTWSTPQRLSSGDIGCLYEQPLSIDLSGNTLVIASGNNNYLHAEQRVRVYTRDSTGWHLAYSIPANTPGSGGVAAIQGNELLVTNALQGTLVYGNDASRTVLDHLRTTGTHFEDQGGAIQIRKTGDLILQANHDHDRGIVINAFQKNPGGRYEHVAILVPRADSLNAGFDASGRRVLASGYFDYHTSNAAAYAFDLPDAYAPVPIRQFNFESGNAPEWTPTAGSQFSVVTVNGNHVYRQSSLAGNARSVLDNSDGTDQAIEADIRPTAFSGSDRWVGLAVRYTDASNHYYVTLRSSGALQLRRIVAGSYSVLARRNLEVVAGRSYRVHLQAIGANLNVYVDGHLEIQMTDANLPRGRVALVGYRAAAEFDNVMVEDIGQTSIFDFPFGSCQSSDITNHWTTDGGAWNCDHGPLLQTSIAGYARAVTGVSTDDQVVRARVRATAFAAPAGTQERWFGLATRYRDSRNFYYLALCTSNKVTLRRAVNGAATILKSASLTVTPDKWYDLRLEAIGDQLRGYVDGKLVLQTTDSTFANGLSGTATYKAAAEYDGFLSYQP